MIFMTKKKDIFEIRIHGRGGQGAKTAAQLIVESAMDQGKEIQAFPEYGPERTGAPMVTYAKISDKPIISYQPVLKPDVVIVIDPTLFERVDVAAGTDKDSVLIVNSTESADKIKKKTKFLGKVYTVDATGISIKNIGRNLPNTPMIGALIKVTGVIELKSVLEKVKNTFQKKIGEEKTQANISSIQDAYKEVK